MNQNPSSADWAAGKGDKWRAQLTGMEPTLSPVDEPLIRALRLEAPCHIAEIGCGGGGTTLEILRRAPPGTTVHGFDISPSLVELARGRTNPEDPAVAFNVADMATTAPTRPYQRLVSRFGVMFFDEPQAAFTNLVRWLVPGGRFAFAVWGPVAENQWMTSVRDAVAQVIELPHPDPSAPGPFRYAEASRLVALLDGAGFADLDVQPWRGALPIGGALPPAEAAAFALSAFSSFGELLAKAGQGSLEEAQRLLTAHLEPHHRDGAVRLDAAVHLVTGARPA